MLKPGERPSTNLELVDNGARSPSASGRHAQLAWVVIAVLTAAIWLALLAWDNERVVTGATEAGPYEPWQVLALIACLTAVFVCALALRHDPVRISLSLSGTLAVCMLLSFTVLAPPSPDASLWPVGVVMVFAGATTGCALVAAVVAPIVRRLRG